MKVVLLAAESGWMNNRVFELDAQLIADVVIMACAVFVLFLALSYFLFNPARKLLKDRQEFIKNQLDTAAKEKEAGQRFKSEYDGKLKNVNKETEAILSEARKKARKREIEIVGEAKEEASRILDRANREIELEKSKAKDEVKREMITIASMMAGKIIEASIDEKKQEELLEDTLKEMGDSTWQS